ncbi:MAG: hypothetical protein IJG68_00965 [Bacilli bacterium]|nr:hypothetical protein [Bacilli bacterium]
MYHKYKQTTTYFIMISLLLIGVVYAILQANLQIKGTAKIKENTWDIHFNNIEVNENSVSIGENDSHASIDPENNCKVDFEVTLSLPGDFYEFTVDVVNSGTIDGMIGELNKTLKVNGESVQETPDYLNYSVTYADGMEILENHKLSAGTTETFLVRLEFKTDIEELPDATTVITTLEPQYIQADSSARIVRVNFATDSWNDIIDDYTAGKTKYLKIAMEAGTTREVRLDMDNDGTVDTTSHVRIANLSTPAECATTGFSQTACGFVIEFADIISTYPMKNDSNNSGSWENSTMRTYVNGIIFNSLPTALKNVVINTKVVSGYGYLDSLKSNYVTTDKLFLLSSKEVHGNSYSSFDTSSDLSRQTDYYKHLEINSNNNTGTIKKYNNENANWWLRSPSSNGNWAFSITTNNGYHSCSSSENNNGVSPAFRIAE